MIMSFIYSRKINSIYILLVVMICRRGNDSQRAVSHLKSEFPKLKKVKDIVGGLHAWGKKIDQKFPIY